MYRDLRLPRLVVVGHAQHGKDTVCDFLKELYGYDFQSSSRFCSRLFIFERLKAKYGYVNEEECFLDRYSHRAEWYDLIHDFCAQDLARLGRELYKQNLIYCGLRNKKEFFAMQNEVLFDFALWVDASDRKPPESPYSMTIEQWMTDYTIDNNGDLDRLKKNIQILMERRILSSYQK